MQPGIRGGGGTAHAGGTGDDEASKDPGVRITHQSYTEKDYEGIEISFVSFLNELVREYSLIIESPFRTFTLP